jgi:uncharacterized repeat protein (TIGR04042 family)
MPETSFMVRWPDGFVERCYSPSLVVEELLTAGRSYPLPEFVERSRTALTEASARVKARYGVGCAEAAAQLERIERRAGGFAAVPEAHVTVEGFAPW